MVREGDEGAGAERLPQLKAKEAPDRKARAFADSRHRATFSNGFTYSSSQGPSPGVLRDAERESLADRRERLLLLLLAEEVD